MRIVPDKSKSEDGIHWYGPDSPGVTTILDVIPNPGLEWWKANTDPLLVEAVSSQATTLGTRVHKYVELVAQGKDPQAPKEHEHFIRAIRDFLDTHVEEVILTEVKLRSKLHKYGGTVDMYCRLKSGELAVVDFKTSKKLERKNGLQVMAYGMLLMENGYPVDRRMVVRLRKEKGGEGKYQLKEYFDHTADKSAFLGCLALWKWMNQSKIENRKKAKKNTKAA